MIERLKQFFEAIKTRLEREPTDEEIVQSIDCAVYMQAMELSEKADLRGYIV